MTKKRPPDGQLLEVAPANTFTSKLLSPALVVATLLLSGLIGATFGGSHQHAAAVKSGIAPVTEPLKIFPADPLDTTNAWSPLTGDGSN